MNAQLVPCDATGPSERGDAARDCALQKLSPVDVTRCRQGKKEIQRYTHQNGDGRERAQGLTPPCFLPPTAGKCTLEPVGDAATWMVMLGRFP
jgi:hypothetical protein